MDGTENEMDGITESTATFTLDDEDNSLDELTEGLETRADDDDEFRDVVSHVQDKVSQIMGANLTNVSACMSVLATVPVWMRRKVAADVEHEMRAVVHRLVSHSNSCPSFPICNHRLSFPSLPSFLLHSLF